MNNKKFRELHSAMTNGKLVRFINESDLEEYRKSLHVDELENEFQVYQIEYSTVNLSTCSDDDDILYDVDVELIEIIDEYKFESNEDKLQNFFDDIDTIEAAILRERILTILELSVQQWEENPEKWDNPFYGISYMKSLRDKAEKHMSLK